MKAASLLYNGVVVDASTLTEVSDGRTTSFHVTQEHSCVIIWRLRYGGGREFHSVLPIKEKDIAIERAVHLTFDARGKAR